MFDRVRDIGRELRDLASWIRRERLPAEDAASLIREVGAIENTCASLRVLLSRRIAEFAVAERRSAICRALRVPGHEDDRFQGHRNA